MRTERSHAVPRRTGASNQSAFLLMLLAACSSPAPSDGRPDALPPLAPQPPADVAPNPILRGDTTHATVRHSQDAFFEGSEHAWLEAQERGVTFRALGQEPGWLLEISRDRSIRVVTDYGAVERVFAPVPDPVVDSTRWITTYRARADSAAVRIHIRDEPCADTMSGERFPATVTLVLNGTPYHGCGRALDVLLP